MPHILKKLSEIIRTEAGGDGIGMVIIVRKSEIFFNSKIFVAKTFRIKRVNCVNFKFAKRHVKVSLQDFMHKHGPNMLRILSGSYRHISRSSGLFLDYPDTFSRLSGHISKLSGHL